MGGTHIRYKFISSQEKLNDRGNKYPQVMSLYFTNTICNGLLTQRVLRRLLRVLTFIFHILKVLWKKYLYMDRILVNGSLVNRLYLIN